VKASFGKNVINMEEEKGKKSTSFVAVIETDWLNSIPPASIHRQTSTYHTMEKKD
jgi:hypothetical protein